MATKKGRKRQRGNVEECLSVFDAFDQAQDSLQRHDQLVRELYRTIQQSPSFETFWKEFLHYLQVALTIFESSPEVRRTIEFAAKVALFVGNCGVTVVADMEADMRLVVRLFDFALKVGFYFIYLGMGGWLVGS